MIKLLNHSRQPTSNLSSLGNTTFLHTFILLAHTAFLQLANLLLLCVFEITLVTKFHQVSRLVDFALESTEGAFDGFAITNFHLDLHAEFGRWPDSYKESVDQKKENEALNS